MPKHKDITDQRFTHLIAIEYLPDYRRVSKRGKSYGAFWKCRCDCGREAIISYHNLAFYTHQKTCGNRDCEFYQYLKCQKRRPGDSGFTNLYHNYRTGRWIQDRRDKTFYLTKDEARALFESNCFYCGQPPSQVSKGESWRGRYLYNGIDRIDSLKGYTVDNTRPCCKRCNRMKNDSETTDWYDHMERILRHVGRLK